ncbi:MAG: dienelactone hydrolase family protein [Woeseiaceae bacterium]|nr:dienelactone hydrolase family protein [Woeseiaceae bacterium]
MADTVELCTGSGNPAGAVIWLHGLGADGHDFEPIVPELRLDPDLSLRFVFPHAPVRPVTLNGGMPMRAWYDIVSLDRGGPVDRDGIVASKALVEALIERERERGIDSDRIVVAGFSQGGAIALTTALTHRTRLAGLVALSTWLPMPDALAADAPRSADLPVFMAHGRFDPVVPIALGEASRAAVEAAGFTVDWHEYPMAHGVCPEEVGHIGAWLRQVYGGRTE